MALTDGIVAYWKFDEGSGTTAADATGNGHTATLNGTVGWQSPGKVGASAVSYPGVSGSGTSIASPPSLGLTFTYAAWIYVVVDGGSGYQNLCATTSNDGFWFRSSKIDAYFGGDNSSSTTISTGAWHHVAASVNAGSLTFYLDGAADGTATISGAFVPNGMGADGGSGGEPFNGYHDEVGLWDRALSAAEVSALYNGGAGLAYPFASPGAASASGALSLAGTATAKAKASASGRLSLSGTAAAFTCTAVVVGSNVNLSWPAAGTSYAIERDGALLAFGYVGTSYVDTPGPGDHSYRVGVLA